MKKTVISTVHHGICRFADPACIRTGFDWLAITKAACGKPWILTSILDKGLQYDKSKPDYDLFTTVYEFEIESSRKLPESSFLTFDSPPRSVFIIKSLHLEEIKDTSEIGNSKIVEIVNDVTVGMM